MQLGLEFLVGAALDDRNYRGSRVGSTDSGVGWYFGWRSHCTGGVVDGGMILRGDGSGMLLVL